MKTIESFQKNLNTVNNENINDFALKLFHFQAQNNEIYRRYLNELNIDPISIKSIHHIPFLPIEFFKQFTVKTGTWKPQVIFESSGTTGQIRSKHHVRQLAWYLKNAERIFNTFYGDLKDFHILALLPSYLERNNSSLVAMTDHFIKKSGSEYSGFYLDEVDELYRKLLKLKDDKKKTILIGVTFALLDFCGEYPIDFKELIVIETGGMKGRRKEMIRGEVHAQLKKGFSVEMVHSEYGMTELLSQAYSFGDGKYVSPSSMRVILREINDPFQYKNDNKTGAINIIDLANIETCAFIETKDLGLINQDGTFEILGRFDNSELRGCNMMSI